MIRVTITRDDGGRIAAFRVAGHAGYAPRGQDIVCAAVSGIVFGMISAVERVLGVVLDVETPARGDLTCRVPELPEEALRERVNLLLEGMVAALQSLTVEYGQFVQVSDPHTPGR